MKKRLKKIGKQMLALILSVIIVAGFMHHCKPLQDASSAFREVDYEYTVLLEEDIPLGVAEQASVCLQALKLINDYRAEFGLGALLWNRDLEAAAAIRADEAGVCWSHTRPNGKPWYTVNPSIMYGENLGRGYDDAGSLVQAWKDSPAHNENLLYADFSYAAISYVNGVYALEFA